LLPPIVSKSFGWVNYQKQHLVIQHEREFADNPKATLPPMPEYTYDNFKQDCVELLTQMKKRYSVAFEYEDFILQILLGMKEGENAKLYYLDSKNCLPVPVPEAVLIGQSQLGEWLRKSWNPNMTMQQTAKLGILTIKYIEKEEISKEIGVGNYSPQVWYIAEGNNIQPREILDAELQTLVSNADEKCKSLQRKVHSLFRT